MRPWRHIGPSALVLGLSMATQAGATAPILHEPIPVDPREDVALALSLDGELPAAIDTRSGLVTAPDPTRPADGRQAPYAPGPQGKNVPDATFHPDRDTRRPDALPYDEPFNPSTAPFKRLSAYDSVDSSFTLYVKNPRLTPMTTRSGAAIPATEEAFYADFVVDLVPGQKARIPSVAPGTRIIKARAGVGTTDIPFRLYKDGAENWFVEGETMTRARLVMHLAAPRAAFGGAFGDPPWSALPLLAPLPPNVAKAAEEVAGRIGVGRHLPPRENVTRLVAYFRSFVDSEEPPPQVRDIYTDLALGKKGVCRHRAFAFLVTALWLGLPARMVANEAHAWVEVHDGALFRRIDLGGAGNMLHDPLSANVPFESPPDAFSWPLGSTRGEDLGNRAREAQGGASPGGGTGGPGQSGSAVGPGLEPTGGADPSASGSGSSPASRAPSGGASGGADAIPLDDGRPGATLALAVSAPVAARGGKLSASGVVKADGEACPHVSVELVLHEKSGKEFPVGALATDAAGRYEGTVVLPRALPLGSYELIARTAGDTRCGKGQSR